MTSTTAAPSTVPASSATRPVTRKKTPQRRHHPVNLVTTTALMSLSQGWAWFQVESVQTPSEFYNALFVISSFYCCWGLWKRYWLLDTNEIGHLTMGLVSLAARPHHQVFCLATVAAVLFHFSLVALVFLRPCWKSNELLVQRRWKTHHTYILPKNRRGEKEDGDHEAVDTRAILSAETVWAHTFRGYFVSSMLLWTRVLFLIYAMDDQEPSCLYVSSKKICAWLIFESRRTQDDGSRGYPSFHYSIESRPAAGL